MADETFKVAVATTDGINVDSHFGHVKDFTIFEIDPETGKGEAVENRIINRAACDGDCGEIEVFGNIAKELSDVEYVIAARIGIPAVMALGAENITAFDGFYSIDEALKKVNQHRKKRKSGEERVKKILLANGIEDK